MVYHAVVLCAWCTWDNLFNAYMCYTCGQSKSAGGMGYIPPQPFLSREDIDVSELEKIRMGKGELGRVVVMRLGPGCDLMKSLEEMARKEDLRSGVVLSGAGSLREVTIRNVRLFPDEFPIVDRNRIFTPKKEPLEMLSLSGSISRRDGEVHIHCHITISSGLDDGRAYGGHLIEGCVVFSTCEVAIGEVTGLEMKRNIDPQTHVPELYFES